MKMSTPISQHPPAEDPRWRVAGGLFRRWLTASSRGDWGAAAEIRIDLFRAGFSISIGSPHRLVPRQARPGLQPLRTPLRGR